MSAPPPSDARLLARIARGDPEALTAWFEGTVDALYAFVYYRVGHDADLAADVAQSTFALALERLDRYDPQRGDMVTWLRLLSRNVIRDTLAAHRRAAQLQTTWDNIDASLHRLYERMDADLLPPAALERSETRELVSTTLANLPPHYREVLEAKYMDGRSLRAIAATRQATVDSVKSMLHRAREAFRETFLTLARSGAI
ncbi:MAG: RNA polymerase sigma factor [Candidatus Brocadiia bacterium]